MYCSPISFTIHLLMMRFFSSSSFFLSLCLLLCQMAMEELSLRMVYLCGFSPSYFVLFSFNFVKNGSHCYRNKTKFIVDLFTSHSLYFFFSSSKYSIWWKKKHFLPYCHSEKKDFCSRKKRMSLFNHTAKMIRWKSISIDSRAFASTKTRAPNIKWYSLSNSFICDSQNSSHETRPEHSYIVNSWKRHTILIKWKSIVM